MKKKFLKIITIMFLAIFAFGMNVFAKETINSANITVNSSKNQYNVGETAEFMIHLNNLDASKGIITFGASIEYNSSILKLLGIEGTNGWSSNDSSSNIIAIIRTSNSENNEDIAKIKFEVLKPAETTTLGIKLNNVDMSNGASYKVKTVNSNNITVNVPTTENPGEQPGGGSGSQTTPPTQGGDSGNEGGSGDSGQTTNPPSSGGETQQGGSQSSGNQGGSSGNGSSGNTGSGSSGNTGSGSEGNSGNLGGDSSNPGENPSDTSSDENINNGLLIETNSKDDANSKEDTTNEKIPQLGANNVIKVIIILAIVIAIMLFAKIKLIDKKIKKRRNKNE